jgi:hypothetical protein
MIFEIILYMQLHGDIGRKFSKQEGLLDFGIDAMKVVLKAANFSLWFLKPQPLFLSLLR